ncbi:4-(cytidine 5'-diphospho)-2-C-methyl-D-erythritol kinase [Patescibacteria group bacterium]
MSILIQANAKLNLGLKILEKLPTGYHRIESVFQSVDLADFLYLKKSDKNTLTGAIVCPESENIIFKSKRILEDSLGKKLPCEIHLHKTIPISAGLGGGSADAAAILMGLNLLYGLELSQKNLAEIGIKAGSDVPFFFYGGTCKVGGTGEIITPTNQEVSKFFVIFRPHKRIETKKMYELHDQTGKDFLALNKEICPAVAEIENYIDNFKIERKGLSGSGPTFFCGINDSNLAKEIAEGLENFNGDIFICHPADKALNYTKI